MEKCLFSCWPGKLRKLRRPVVMFLTPVALTHTCFRTICLQDVPQRLGILVGFVNTEGTLSDGLFSPNPYVSSDYNFAQRSQLVLVRSNKYVLVI